MDGRNCTGRKISLLNDSGDAAAVPSKIQLPYLAAHSRASSCTSTPSLSPQTPQLVRSSSSDSRALSTPSPLTPSFNSFDSAAQQYLPPKPLHQQPQHHQPSQHQQHYYLQNHAYTKMDDQNASMYPPIPDATGAMPSAYPMPPQMVQQQPMPQPQNPGQAFRASTSPSSEPSRVSNASAQSNSKAPQKKNQYPCPMAKQVGCNDFFTTSGHAARHAKKHTGKKDAFCPECNKAFTRKDNMEQHRRTHQNGRGSSRSTNDDSKVKKPTKSAKKTTVKNEPALEAAVQQQLAEQTQAEQAQQVARAVEQVQVQPPVQPLPAEQPMLMPVGPYFVGSMDTGPVPALPMAPDLSIRPPLQRSQYASSLDYVAPTAAMIDPDALNYSYPSPGLSNGLHSLALAADEHRRHSEEKLSARSPSSETSSDSKTP
ncbi:Transcription factor Sp3 [Pseudocercospora fuligena]|uniref:Transcription factor Sp3 n=1 Tax=Pseudocercospora fuligena TaxID=685502 RepID=A0A8H6RNG9_9PEZI|nr:Transcription factor Sp3 [Pseudocercospora fuligena]